MMAMLESLQSQGTSTAINHQQQSQEQVSNSAVHPSSSQLASRHQSWQQGSFAGMPFPSSRAAAGESFFGGIFMGAPVLNFNYTPPPPAKGIQCGVCGYNNHGDARVCQGTIANGRPCNSRL
jgi:hypothetical protein